MGRRKSKRALARRHGGRRRHGHAMGPQPISRPLGGGMYKVVLVDSKGTELRTIAKRVPYTKALQIIEGHGG